MRLLVTGTSGLLGSVLVKRASENGNEVFASHKMESNNGENLRILDLSKKESVTKVVQNAKPNAVIHAAAMADVDKCEEERELAYIINSEGTKNVAEACKSVGAFLVYISTDYVFDGLKGFYSESDYTKPIGWYAITKFKGEEYVRQRLDNFCIARTSVVYGWGRKQRFNFATWLLDNLRKGKQVNVLTDQYVSPTYNCNLADMLLEIAERSINGVLHTAGASRVSRYNFALKLANVFGLDTNLIRGIKIDDINWKAKRPRDSSLDVSRAMQILKNKPLSLERSLMMMKEDEQLINAKA